MQAVAGRHRITVPDDVSITTDVAIGPMSDKDGAFAIDVAAAVSIPGMCATGWWPACPE